MTIKEFFLLILLVLVQLLCQCTGMDPFEIMGISTSQEPVEVVLNVGESYTRHDERYMDNDNYKEEFGYESFRCKIDYKITFLESAEDYYLVQIEILSCEIDPENGGNAAIYIVGIETSCTINDEVYERSDYEYSNASSLIVHDSEYCTKIPFQEVSVIKVPISNSQSNGAYQLRLTFNSFNPLTTKDELTFGVRMDALYDVE